MKTTIMPAPSPNGTNHERLFLVRAPRGTSAGALDAALKRGRGHDRHRGHGHDEEQVDLAELRERLEMALTQCVSGDALAAVIDVLDEHMPTQDRRARDRHHGRDEQHEPAAERTREQMERYLKGLGCTEETVKAVLGEIGEEGEDESREELFGERELPHNALHNDYDRAVDRKRGARGHAMDAASVDASFNRMFPGAARIKLGG